MPHVFNGIGTWHHGKANRIVRRDFCEFCGEPGDLQSYDTRHFFVVVFVPVVPIGARRILDHCPHCKQFRALPLSKWKREKADATDAALAAFRSNPDDPEAALDVCRTLIQFQERAIFTEVAPALENRFQHNAKVLEMAAAGHSYFNRHDLAAQAAAKSLALDPANAELRRTLALYQMRAGVPAEAAATLSQLAPPKTSGPGGPPALPGAASAGTPPDPGIHLLLAEAFQYQGEHEPALEQFDTALAIAPELAQDKPLSKSREFSLKNRSQQRPRPSAFFQPVRITGNSAGGFHYWWPNAVAGGLWLALIAVIATVLTAPMRPRPLHLVNGLPVPYTVTISDQNKTLAPYSRTSITLAPEDHDVIVSGEGLTIPPSKLALADAIGPSPNRVEIINPDGVALFLDEVAYYHLNPEQAPHGTYKIPEPATFHSLYGITHAFKDLPETVDIRSGSSRAVSRRQLTLLDRGPWDNLRILADVEGIERASAHARALIDRIGATNDHRLTYIATSAGEPEMIRAWMQPHLAQRDPLDIELHRAWQDFARHEFDQHDLEAEYNALLEADPGNSDLVYLRGRALGGHKASPWFERAAAMDPPSLDALNALAYNSLQSGNYAEALANAQRATALPGANQRHHNVLHTCLAATGNWSALADKLQADSEGSLDDPFLMEQVITALDIAGRSDEADQLVSAVLAHLDRQMSSSTDAWKKRYAAVRAYLRGDMITFTDDPGTTGFEFAAAVTQGDVAAAAAVLEAHEDKSWQNHLIVSLMAARAGDETTSTVHLVKAREDSTAPPALQQILDPHTACDPAVLEWTNALPYDIRIAAAYRFRIRPDEAATWKAILEQSNFDPLFPHRFLTEE